MNILIPDSWLREFLKTNATPADIARCISLCGPSVERIEEANGDSVYDIEITTNRIDSFSVYGVAQEAAVILPQFGFKATLAAYPTQKISNNGKPDLDIAIVDKKQLCRRILAVKIEHIKLAASPDWMQEKLTKVGQRSLNNIIDITNYVMWETGHPCHAFDYDRLKKKTIIAGVARKGQTAITLDNKHHAMRGGEIIFDDGTGEIIDIPGIMGTANTVVSDTTKNVLLFVENSDPALIRFTSMGLGIRTQAATINEKSPDPELAYIAIGRAAGLACEIAGGRVASKLYDHYPKPYKPTTVSVTRQKVDSYLGVRLKDGDIKNILTSLGFRTHIDTSNIEVSVPSRRRDVEIDVDIIEEIARIYGYHHIANWLPTGELPMPALDPILAWEDEIKIRLRDWGFTELYTYSMISEKQIDAYSLDKTKAYKIANPLSEEWVYMRPSLEPGFLAAIKENRAHRTNLRVFELSKVYGYQKDNLPSEEDMLIVGVTGNKFLEVKGVGEAILQLFGISSPLESYGSIQIKEHVGLLVLSITKLARDAKPNKTYIPIPKYPPVVEDLTFIVPERFEIGPLLAALKTAHPLVSTVSFLDSYENTRTIHITYQDPEKNLTSEEIVPVREKLIQLAKSDFGAILKSS